MGRQTVTLRPITARKHDFLYGMWPANKKSAAHEHINFARLIKVYLNFFTSSL